MKKVLLFLIAIALIIGVGYFGYTVLNSKNIESIEIEGNMQTLYLLDEASTPNYQDAKLKITYKNGSTKYKNLAEAGVTCDKFTTSIEKFEDEMVLTYKSVMISVKYTVVQPGMYYLSAYNKATTSGSVDKQYTLSTTNSFYYIDKGGVLKYYAKEDITLSNGTVNAWVLYDGSVIKSYRYEVVDDRIDIYLGEDEVAYSIKTSRPAGNIITSSENEEVNDSGLTVKKETYTFTHYDVLTNLSVKTDSVALVCNYTSDTPQSPKYLAFRRNQTIKSSGHKIYLTVSYNNYLVYSDSVKLLKDVYVYVDDAMVKNNTLNTKDKNLSINYADIAYATVCDERTHLYYKVVD